MAGPATKAVIDIDLEGQAASADIDKLSQQISDFAGTVETAFYSVGAFVAVDQLKDMAGEMLGVFNEAEAQARVLEGTLETTGNTTGFTETQLASLRQQVEEVSTTSADMAAVIQNNFARTRLIGGEVFLDATQAALDFAAATEIDAVTASEELAEALIDPANELERFRRFGITFTEQQKKMLAGLQRTGRGVEAQQWVLAELNKVVGGQSAKEFESFAGQQAKLENRVNALKAGIGELISNALAPMMPSIISLVEAMSAWLPVIQEITSGVVENISALFEWLTPIETTANAISEWVAFVQVAFTRWKDFIAIALLNAGASVVGFATDIQYYFTEVIPTYAKSLWIIMKDIFLQLDDIIGTVVSNIMTNIEGFWSALKAVMSGEDFEFTPTSLLEGFELKLSELPSVADKQISETEKIMRQAADDLAIDIGKDLAARTKFEIEKSEQAAEAAKVAEVQAGAVNADVLGQGEKGNAGGTEGLLDLANRISGAAASDPVQQAVNEVAVAANNTTDAVTNMKDTVTGAIKQTGQMTVTAIQKLNLNGTFG
jgi:hypothetical protein